MAYQFLLPVIVILIVNSNTAAGAANNSALNSATQHKPSAYDRICRPGTQNSTLGCDSQKNLYCHPQRRTCRCIEPPSSINATHNYEWDNHVGACVLVQRHYYRNCALLHFRNNGTHPDGSGKLICKLDSQCQATSLGAHSRCNLETCTCECVSNVHLNVSGSGPIDERSVWKKNGSCYIQRRLGEVCNSTQECASIDIEGGGSQALCSSETGICVCDSATHVRVEAKCVRSVISLETEPCEYDVQCQALDPLANCVNASEGVLKGQGLSSDVRVCRCTNGTKAYEGRCYHSRGYNETCSHDEECRLGLGPGAKCNDRELILDFGSSDNETVQEEPGVCECGDGDEDAGDGVFEFDYSTSTCVRVQSETDTEAMMDLEAGNNISARNGTLSFAFLFPKPQAPASEDTASTIDWVKPTVIISTAVILTILVTGLLVAYSNWKRVKLVRRMEHELKESKAGQPLLKGLSESGFEVGEDDFDIEHEAVLGSGRNGIVYQGYFKPRSIQVAVKTNRELVSSHLYLRAILEEAKVLIHLGSHPNVVQFYGVCQATINKGNVYLFCELCPLGSLETFLRTNRSMFDFWPQEPNAEAAPSPLRVTPPTHTRPGSEDRSDYRMSMLIAESHSRASTTSAESSSSKLFQSHLYKWAYQIASAMEFVSARKVIHSDLAARNVLLSSIDCVKLTDFGLSRRLYDNYTYMKMGKDPLPWKWLDYDALRFMIFTTHTDVWSYGITLWEIWTLGEVPYPGIVTPYCQNFISRLLEGLHPTQPEYVSVELYGLMVKCWNPNPNGRPCFSWLKEELGIQMKKLGYSKGGCGKGAGYDELDGFGYLLPMKNSK